MDNSNHGQLVFVFAPHPDDEVIAVGGTICRHRMQGDRVLIIFSTDGSESHAAVLGIHDDPYPSELARIRQDESFAAAAKLDIPPEDVVQLHLQDTQLVRDVEPLTRSIEALFTQYSEVATVYFPDPDRELNADHRITGATVLACVHKLGLHPKLMKYVVWDRDLEKAFEYQNRLDTPVSIDDTELIESIDIMPYHQTKLAALAQHKTQVELFSKSQKRTVVPTWLLEKLKQQMVEQFRVHPSVAR